MVAWVLGVLYPHMETAPRVVTPGAPPSFCLPWPHGLDYGAQAYRGRLPSVVLTPPPAPG